jgi:hypothetical protein
MKARLWGIASDLERLHLAHHGIAADPLGHGEEAVGHRENGMLARPVATILAQEKRCRLPGSQLGREPLHELAQPQIAVDRAVWFQGAEGIDDHNLWSQLLHLADNGVQHAAQIVTQHLFRQIDEMNDVVHLRQVEEGELLLIAQHLERRLPQQREVHAGRAADALANMN